MKKYKKNLLIAGFVCLSYSVKAQLPVLKSNTTEIEKANSLIYKNFYGKYDFVVSCIEESYWWGNRRFYKIFACKNGRWEKISLSQKEKKNDEWSKPVIHTEEFDKDKADSLMSLLNKNGFWKLNKDSLNITQRRVSEKQDQVFSISDGVNYKFEIFSNKDFQIIESYSPDYFYKKMPEIKCRGIFIRCRDLFLSAYNKKTD